MATSATNATVRVEGKGGGAMDARKQEERIANIQVLTAAANMPPKKHAKTSS